MGIYISGVSLPKMPDHFEQGEEVPYIDIRIFASGHAVISKGVRPYFDEFKAIEVPPHGRLGDLDALRRTMYHEAFETDSPMQKWDSGCWIRYKLFERMEEAAPTIIPAEGGIDNV